MKFLNYDYKERKKKVEEILDDTDVVNEVDKFPREEEFTYTNGYKSIAGAIFVDLRDSTTLFSGNNDVEIAKVIRGFTSEVIEILRKDTENDLKEIGIRGDCVYAVYSSRYTKDIYEIANRAFYINSYIKMLNKLLEERSLPNIKVGIGLAASDTLAVKAGRKSSGISNLVWIGESVSKAAKLSDLGNKNGINPIVMSELFYDNYIDEQLKQNDDAKEWWKVGYNSNFQKYYHAHVIQSDFDNWIDDGMED